MGPGDKESGESSMLFSGMIQSYRCRQCNAGFSHVIPTSLLPIAVVVIFSGAFWGDAIFLLIAIRWIACFLGFFLGFATFLCSLLALDRFMKRKFSDRVCPKCGGELEAMGGGFYDGGGPDRLELLAYAVTILIAFGAWAAMESM